VLREVVTSEPAPVGVRGAVVEQVGELEHVARPHPPRLPQHDAPDGLAEVLRDESSRLRPERVHLMVLTN
jgi:hypothetical protein